MDWNEIRKEYIQGGITYRELATKYGVPLKTLATKAKAEDWVGLKQQASDKAATETVKAVAREAAKVNKRIYHIAGDLLDVLERSVGELDAVIVTKRSKLKTKVSEVSTERREVDESRRGPIDRAGLRQAADTLRTLKEILDVRSDLDAREQEARIANLQRQVEKDSETVGGIEVTFDAGEDEWNE